MLDAAEIRARYDEQCRGFSLVGPPWVQEYDGPLLRVHGGNEGFVSGPPDLTGTDLDALIERQVTFFAQRGESFEWKTRAHDLPADIPQRLLAHGFVAEPQETVLVAQTAGLLTLPPLPGNIAICRAESKADFQAIARMQERVWGGDQSWWVDEVLNTMQQDPQSTVVFVAMAEDQVVSAARIEFIGGSDFAGLWGGSTDPAWRGLGIYRRLVAQRAQVASERGVPLLQVDASAESAPILRRLGFVEITTTTPYMWRPTAKI